jgi:hypothetical protein
MGKKLEATALGTTYLRLPIKTRLIEETDDLMALLKEYVMPHLQTGDLLFVSEKIVCITQNRMVPIKSVKTSALARFLSQKVRNHVGTPQFRGYGHGTAPAMQLLIEEAGVLRVLFAAFISAITRPLGIKGAGEGGIAAAGAVIASAVDDALGGACTITQLPITPQYLKAIIDAADAVVRA